MIEPNEKARSRLRPLPKWKKILLIASVVATTAGGGLYAFSHFRDGGSASRRQTSTDPSKGGATESHPDLKGGLVEGGVRKAPAAGLGDDDAEPAETGATTDSFAPFLMYGGLSFFVGFCMGYAVRVFFKVSALFIGAAALIFFALQYFGVVPGIEWAALEDKFHGLMTGLGHQLGNFKAFVEGHLPSSAAATAGVFSGWKKN